MHVGHEHSRKSEIRNQGHGGVWMSKHIEQTPGTFQERMKKQKQIRILHVVSVMDRGGIETWLMHILRNIDRSRFAMDFLTQTTKSGQFDDEIRDLGSRILPCLYPHRPWLYASGMRNVLANNSPYRVIHSHVHHYSGFILRLASRAGIPVRIAHSHSETSAVDASASWSRKCYLGLSRQWISRFASYKLAASKKAALSLFGPQHSQNAWRILPCGVELGPFGLASDRRAVREELGIPESTMVIGHVGRFVDLKNHEFLVRIAAEIVTRNANTHFLLVGDGPLRTRIEQQVAHLNLAKHFSFLGVRSDVPRLMSGGMDAFLFPSRNEGLGLVLVEAQAAGLPCFYSNCVPEEADIVHPLVHRVSLDQSATVWANLLLNILGSRETPMDKRAALEIVQESAFNIKTSLRGLEDIYEEDHNNRCIDCSHLI
jgi:glycosyltransferase involved in cell wall biosynthesis